MLHTQNGYKWQIDTFFLSSRKPSSKSNYKNQHDQINLIALEYSLLAFEKEINL